ncbi:MAG TPA: hypothetical protein VIZ32_10260 [Vicinamibacterales bacterium]
MSNSIAIFFDLGDTLVIPQFGTDGALAALRPLPFVTEVLDRVRSDGTVAAPHRLGVMSNTPATATTASMKTLLAQAGLFSRFEPALLLYSSVEGHQEREGVLHTGSQPRRHGRLALHFRRRGRERAGDRGVRRLSGLVPPASPLSRVASDSLSWRPSKGVSDV